MNKTLPQIATDSPEAMQEKLGDEAGVPALREWEKEMI